MNFLQQTQELSRVMPSQSSYGGQCDYGSSLRGNMSNREEIEFAYHGQRANRAAIWQGVIPACSPQPPPHPPSLDTAGLSTHTSTMKAEVLGLVIRRHVLLSYGGPHSFTAQNAITQHLMALPDHNLRLIKSAALRVEAGGMGGGGQDKLWANYSAPTPYCLLGRRGGG